MTPALQARSSGQPPACTAPATAERSVAAIYDEEEPQEPAPPEARDPSDDPHPWQPHDESLSPFDGDDEEEEYQA